MASALKKKNPKPKLKPFPSKKQIIQPIVQMQIKPPLKSCAEDSILFLTLALMQLPALF